MKKLFLIAAITMSLLLGGCGSKETTTETTQLSLEDAEALVYRTPTDLVDQEFNGMHYKVPASWTVENGDDYVSYYGDHNIYIQITKNSIDQDYQTYSLMDAYLKSYDGCTAQLMGFAGLYDGFQIEGSIKIEDVDRYFLAYYVRPYENTMYNILGCCDKDSNNFLSGFLADFERTMSFD